MISRPNSNPTHELDVEWLKTNCLKAHFFGLGFIQVKLTENARLHFYHPDIPAFVEEPHDHRYDFISTVIKGCLGNMIWKLLPGKDYEVSYESCRQNGPETPPGFRTGLGLLGSFQTLTTSEPIKGRHPRNGYHMNSETLHTVEPIFGYGPVITLVEREPPRKEFARTVRKVGDPATCPFSRPMPEDELWSIVQKCIEA